MSSRILNSTPISRSTAASAIVFCTRSPLTFGASSFTEKGQSCTPGSSFARLDLVAVVKNGGARFHQAQVPVHRVLIERHHDVELIAEAEHRLVAGAEREKNVAAAHNGLVGVVSVQVQIRGARRCAPGYRRASQCLDPPRRRLQSRDQLVAIANPLLCSLRRSKISRGDFLENLIHLFR